MWLLDLTDCQSEHILPAGGHVLESCTGVLCNNQRAAALIGAAMHVNAHFGSSCLCQTIGPACCLVLLGFVNAVVSLNSLAVACTTWASHQRR